MVFDPLGWLTEATHTPSPNFAQRVEGVQPSLVVVHAISLPPREFGGSDVRALLCNTLNADAHPYFAQISHLRVSAHFFIARDGEIEQFVSCDAVAWHAGVSVWKLQEACNGFSIGIELEGCDELPFTAAQYQALAAVLSALKQRYPTLADAAGHSDVAPGRKSDPGPCFDWAQVDSSWQKWR